MVLYKYVVSVHRYIKVWVSGKIQSRFQQNICLVYHAQNWSFLSTFEAGNLNLLFFVITAFCDSYHKIDAAILRRTTLQIRLCIQLMKNSPEKFLLIQILRDKIFIAIVSKHFKKLNFVICLFFKESK